MQLWRLSPNDMLVPSHIPNDWRHDIVDFANAIASGLTNALIYVALISFGAIFTCAMFLSKGFRDLVFRVAVVVGLCVGIFYYITSTSVPDSSPESVPTSSTDFQIDFILLARLAAALGLAILVSSIWFLLYPFLERVPQYNEKSIQDTVFQRVHCHPPTPRSSRR